MLVKAQSSNQLVLDWRRLTLRHPGLALSALSQSSRPTSFRSLALRTGILYAYTMVETTYTSLRENLASMMDRVINDREVVIVRRRTPSDC